MITEAILNVLLLPLRWLLEVIPSVSWPSWFQVSGPDSVVSQVASWGSHLGTIGGWFPLGAFFDSMAIVFVCAGIHVVIKLTRIIVSALTGGGGAV
jgi:hypothetical protein